MAFSSRLMFTVGDCETGRRNVVIFNGIHNKTSLSGGPEKLVSMNKIIVLKTKKKKDKYRRFFNVYFFFDCRYGFPDPQYFDRVKRELAAVGITEQLLETSTDW